jgi:23S rRNA pseudouridine2605 synthase
VGRLDINSEGLLLLTNNPSLSDFLEKPINSIERTYIVKVYGKVINKLPLLVKQGIKIKEITYEGIDVKILTKKKNNYLQMSIYEGKNREIRKVLEHFRLQVKTLKRISYGPFFLNQLEKGGIMEINKNNLKNNLKKIKFKDESDFREI